MPNFLIVPYKNGGDPVIEPVAGYATNLHHLLIFSEGDALFYRGGRFDVSIAPSAQIRSKDRLAGLTDESLGLVSRVTHISETDLREIRELERAFKAPKVYYKS